MINLFDTPPAEQPSEPPADPVNKLQVVEGELESALKNLLDISRTEQLNAFTQDLYSAMNIWYIGASLHPGENDKNTYMLMSKAVALIINPKYLSEEQKARYLEVIAYEPPSSNE